MLQIAKGDLRARPLQNGTNRPARMSVRVVARIRPLLQSENKKDAIVEAIGTDEASSARPSIVKIPNPKNLSEDFTFQFNGVYDEQASQQELFDAEGTSSSDSPTRVGIDSGI